MLLDASLDIVYKLLAEGALSRIVCQVGVDWCRFSDIPFPWLFLGSGGDYCSSVVA